MDLSSCHHIWYWKSYYKVRLGGHQRINRYWYNIYSFTNGTLSVRTDAIYHGAVRLYMHWYIGEACVRFGMPSSHVYHSDVGRMRRFFLLSDPEWSMKFAVYLLGLIDSDGSLVRSSQVSGDIPSFRFWGVTICQLLDDDFLPFLQSTLEECGYSSYISEDQHSLNIKFDDNSTIGRDFFLPALDRLVSSGLFLSPKMEMMHYMLQNNHRSTMIMWRPHDLSFHEYAGDIEDGRIVVLAE